MPSMPIYNSQRNITQTQSQPLRNEAAQKAQNRDVVIGSITKATQQWSDAHDVMQYTEAKGKYEIESADIQARAAADPNFKDSAKYYKELEDVKKNSLVGISNKQVMEKLSMDMDFSNQMAAIKIDTQFKVKELETNKFNLSKSIEGLQQKKLQASTAAEAAQYDQEIVDLLELNVGTGTITPADADVMLNDAQEISVKYNIYADTATEEEESKVLAELKDPKGKYSFLDPETRLKMIQESQRRIFQNNQTMKKEADVAKDQRFNDIFEKMIKNELTLMDIDAEMNVPAEQGGIDKKQLLTIKEGLEKKITDDLTLIINNNDKALKYYEGIDKFIQDSNDKNKAREAIVQAFRDDVLSPEEGQFLNKLLAETTAIKDSREREKFMQNGLVPFKNAINSINDFFTGKKSTESEKAVVIKNMLNKMIGGSDPLQAKDDAIKQHIFESNPIIKTFPADGQKVMDANGNVMIMYPDGTWKEVK